MSNYKQYDIPADRYKKMFASYLQTDGTQLMNLVRLKYDLVNNYKERLVEFWSLFDIDFLEDRYIEWKNGSRVFDSYGNLVSIKDDKEWEFTDFVERICKTYQITREYYSPWATSTINPDTQQTYETSNILLNNLNMLRMLKIRRSSVGYDGTRESLTKVLKDALNNKYRADATSQLSFILQTRTNPGEHASLNVRVVRPEVTPGDIVWTSYDEYLTRDSEYFISLLGIVVDIETINTDALIFDISKYSDESGNPGDKYE